MKKQRADFEAHALIHINVLARAAVRICDTPEAANDAVQETYLQAWKYWDTFEMGTNCRAWLFRILFNVIKKRAGSRKPTVSLEETPCDNVLQFDPQFQIEESEVLEVFQRLSEDHRKVLLLVAVEELPYKEAAAVLEVPIGTVMSRLSRARAELRRMLERDSSRQNRQVAG